MMKSLECFQREGKWIRSSPA